MSAKKSEDSYGEKVDRCLYNALSKFVVGVGIGIVTAVVVRYKPWPIVLGSGVGIGMGISDCNYEFKSGRSLSAVIKQNMESTKRTSPAFVSQRKKWQPSPPAEEDEDFFYEPDRKERFAGIVGRSSHTRIQDE